MNPEAIEKLIDEGRDSAEARLAAGQARLKAGNVERALEHLEKAVEFKPDYAVAWQLLGKALNEQDRTEEARSAWETGREVARERGDKQVEKVLDVWLRRLNG